MGDKVQVFETSGRELWLDRDQVWWTDRSRVNVEKRCEWKRLKMYHSLESKLGVESSWLGEDLALGSAVHSGMEALSMMGEGMLGGGMGTVEHEAARYAYKKMMEGEGNVAVGGDRYIWEVNPEGGRLLLEEQAALAQGLVYAFGKRVWPGVRDRFESLGAEMEINWLLGWTADGRAIVVMSRPDDVWRDRETSKIYTVSYKTIREFEQWTLTKLWNDPQNWTEGLAVQSKYGVEVAGTLFFYFIKGRKYEDKEMGYDRYTSGLVRPYTSLEMGSLMEPNPLHFKFKLESGGRPPKGWERINVWQTRMGMEGWLGWLEEGKVQGEDWLRTLVADPQVVTWDQRRAERWRMGRLNGEERWAERIGMLDSGAYSREYIEDSLFERTEEACFDFKKPCVMYDNCWGEKTIEGMMMEGRLKPRELNHPVEGDSAE